MATNDYDFAGWVTKNDLLCSDGVVIKHNAFAGNDGAKVPLVWEHVHDDPTNVLGHVILHNRDKGVYGYGYFNGTDQAQHAKNLIEHGDISSMSIAANKIQKQGQDVVHGNIFEVSLVLAGANPGALIEPLMAHGQESNEEAIIHTGNLLHAADDVEGMENNQVTKIDPKVLDNLTPDQQEAIGKLLAAAESSAALDNLTDDQKAAVEAMLDNAYESSENSQNGKQDQQPPKAEPAPKQPANNNQTPDDKKKQGDNTMKHNVFNGEDEGQKTLTHSQLNELVSSAINEKSTLKDAMLEHSITNVEQLFPEVHDTNTPPAFVRQSNTNADSIVNAAGKSPFSRVRSRFANLTEDEARARGYIKGKEKKEQVFGLLKRETFPQTVYKKQKLDRDDIVDITDFDVVSWINQEMRFMLTEEIARAVLVGDGRDSASDDKIQEDHIRPIISDADFFTMKATAKDTGLGLLESVTKSMAEYQGSGTPSMYINPLTLAAIKLTVDGQGRFLYGNGGFPTDQTIAAMFNVKAVVATSYVPQNAVLIVNLSDYQLGSTKGGEVTTFDDFDIDFNQYKYLIETRLSGALVQPHSALYVTVTTTTTPFVGGKYTDDTMLSAVDKAKAASQSGSGAGTGK
jgi:HK97 family phage prohead protease